MSENQDTAVSQFMESLGRSRSSSFSGQSEISDMENEIMQKSGINISKNNEMGKQSSERATTLERQETPLPEKSRAEFTSSGGQFVSGVEEDLDLAQDEIALNDEQADQEELERLMEEKFEETLERREPSEGSVDSQEHPQA